MPLRFNKCTGTKNPGRHDKTEEQTWWKSKTSEGGTVEHSWWNSETEMVEH